MPDIVKNQAPNQEHIETLNMGTKYDLNLSYSGNSDEDIHLVASKFQTYAKLRDFTPDKKVLAFTTCINGHARVFLDSVAEENKTSVEDIVKLLENNFQGETWRWSIESKLLTRKQLTTESLDDYASTIMVACKQLKKPENEMQNIFIRGLLPELRGFVLSQKPESFSTAVDAARLGLSIKLSSQQSLPTASLVTNAQPEYNLNTEVEHKLNSVLSCVSSVSSRLEKLEIQTNKPNPIPTSASVLRYAPKPAPVHGFAPKPGPAPVFAHRSATTQYYDTNRVSTQKNYKFQRTMICHRCGRVGHKWRNCYSKRDCKGFPLNE